MKLSEMFPSNYLSKEDVARPVVATIVGIVQEEIAADGGKELKNVLIFDGGVKKMILNRGNAEAIAAMYGGDNCNAWIGKRIEIYVDPSVMFGGRRVGGVRVRAASAHAPQQYGGSPGFGPAPSTNGEQRWDYSDGQNVVTNQTSAQVLQFLTEHNIDPKTIRVKPAGAPRDQAKTAAEYGFMPAAPQAADVIPF